MDPEQITTIVNCSTPTNVKQVLSFLGFGNLYRRFIREFAKIANPMTALAKKDNLWEWDATCQEAFEGLNEQVTSATILRHCDPSKQAFLETDSSDYVTGGFLSQEDDHGFLHPVAFHKHKMVPAECIYELLATVKGF